MGRRRKSRESLVSTISFLDGIGLALAIVFL